MVTAYSPILKLALPVQGELSGTWGDVVNDNITSMVEQAIAGRAVIDTWTTDSHTLTTANGTTSESRCAMLELTDTGTALTGAGTVICPTASKIYIVKNAAGQNITVKTAAGTGILVPNARTTFLFCDGTNVVEAMTHTTSMQLGTSTVVTAVLDEDDLVSDSATALATQQSIKAYVDAQVTAQDLDFAGDSGTGAIDLDSQSLTIAGTANEIETAASGQTLTVGLPDAVTVTTSVTTPLVQATNVNANDGTSAIAVADSTGQVTVNDAVLTTADINAGTIDNTVIGGTTAAAGSFTTVGATGNITSEGQVITNTINEQTATSGVTVDGVLLKDGGATFTGDVSFGDNNKAIFGAGSDLQIYHDGSNSYVDDTGTGNLYLKTNGTNIAMLSGAEIMAVFAKDDAVTLYHNNTPKIATTSTGIDVTGTVTADGLQVTNAATTGTNQEVASFRTASGGGLVVRSSDLSSANPDSILEPFFGESLKIKTSGNDRFKIQDNGDISFYEDTGTTPKFFWDASAEALGIGTASPSISGLRGVLTVASGSQGIIETKGTTSADGSAIANIIAYNSSNVAASQITTRNDGANGGSLSFITANAGSASEAMRIDSSGNVGIGVVPENSSGTWRNFEQGGMNMAARSSGGVDGMVGTNYVFKTDNSEVYKTTGAASRLFFNDSAMQFQIAASGTAGNAISWDEAMRIDSSGLIKAVSSITSDPTDTGAYWYNKSGVGPTLSGYRFSIRTGGTPTEALRVDESGNVGIGTSSPSALTHLSKDEITAYNGSATDGQLGVGSTMFIEQKGGSNNAIAQLVFQPRTGYGYNRIVSAGGSAPYMTFGTNNAERMRITSSGNVGIGTSSPSTQLDVVGGIRSTSLGGYNQITTTSIGDAVFDNNGNNWLTVKDGVPANAMRIDSSGNVGIGTDSPDAPLHVYTGSGGSQEMLFLQNVASSDNHYLKIGVDNTANEVVYTSSGTSGGAHVFYRTASTEAMRIDASGNLLVGKPALNTNAAGLQLENDGYLSACRDGGNVALINRKSSDGSIVTFQKDGTTVGIIGNNGSRPYICSIKHGLYFGSTATLPTNGAGAPIDNTYDFGVSAYRWDDIYATNGTIQTSDRNEKQDIEVLSDAEQRVAVACKGLLRKFRWKDAVAEKGDDARIHFGIIAQDLQDAFTAEGLDAGHYAMFISNTWTDEETGEERTRLGVRYPELLAFIIAAI